MSSMLYIAAPYILAFYTVVFLCFALMFCRQTKKFKKLTREFRELADENKEHVHVFVFYLAAERYLSPEQFLDLSNKANDLYQELLKNDNNTIDELLLKPQTIN